MNHKFYTMFINYSDGSSDFAIFTSLKTLYRLLLEFIKDCKMKDAIFYSEVQNKVEQNLLFTYTFKSGDWICIQGTNSDENKIINSYNEVMGIRKENSHEKE